jgi:sec-independent protein translocase protein TatA
MMGLDNPIHIAILLVILLLVFGAKRLPEMGQSLGSGLRNFKESVTGEGPETTETLAPAPPSVTTPSAAARTPEHVDTRPAA